jgi:multiple RNA-binding domain-containing protein 1
VHIPVDAETKKPKGFAYVLFLIPEHAVRAFHELDRKTFQGRLLHVLPGKERPSAKPEEGDNDSFKKKKMEKLRAASRKETNWNSLFMSVRGRLMPLWSYRVLNLALV